MTKPNKQIAPLPGRDEDDVLSSVDTVSSSTECTGLIQTPPESEAEADSYTDLYTIPKPAEKKDRYGRDAGTSKKEKGPEASCENRPEAKR